jgi:putative endonuclease
MADPRHVLGARAEAAVAAWLPGSGWRILARRWRCPGGEIDIVALDPEQVLVAIEVKVRRSGRAGDPAASVDRRRVHRLRSALVSFAAASPSPRAGMRIDLASLQPTADAAWRLTLQRGIDAW